MLVKIISVPKGEAPLWVRKAWVGLYLPVRSEEEVALDFRPVLGVLSFNRVEGFDTGFHVPTKQAIDLLAKKNPAAANWWKKNTRLYEIDDVFVFNKECGKLVE